MTAPSKARIGITRGVLGIALAAFFSAIPGSGWKP
jgi:hypothetical protein